MKKKKQLKNFVPVSIKRSTYNNMKSKRDEWKFRSISELVEFLLANVKKRKLPKCVTGE